MFENKMKVYICGVDVVKATDSLQQRGGSPRPARPGGAREAHVTDVAPAGF